MEIKRVEPDRIIIQLDFSKPMKASNTAEFTLATDASRVNLRLVGDVGDARAPKTVMAASPSMGAFMSIASLIGRVLEPMMKGLVDMQATGSRAASARRPVRSISSGSAARAAVGGRTRKPTPSWLKLMITPISRVRLTRSASVNWASTAA